MSPHPATALARLAAAAATGLCALWLVGAPSAQARDRISDRDLERAKDACRQIAENRNWRNVRTDVRDRDQDRDQVIVTMSGRRDGDDRERDCTYDLRNDRASFEDQDDDRGGDRRASDRDVERAKDACRQIAENRNWRNVRTDVRDRDQDRDQVIVTMSGKRDGDDRERECRYDVRRGDAEFDDKG
jgi:hypothetical protein